MVYYEDNYLMHHGIKGQKWGLRRFQNADGTLTPDGKKRYGSGVIGNDRFRPGDVSKRSSNPILNKMGGRKINADYETRRARGEALTKAGRSNIGAVGRHFGRSIAYGVGAGLAVGAISAVTQSSEGAVAVSRLASAGAMAFGVSSIIRSYQDIADMRTYKESEEMKRRN